jgi:arginase
LNNTLLPVGISKLIQSGDIILEWLNSGPDLLEKSGLKSILETNGCTVIESKTAELNAAEANQYGAWKRLGLASRHLADIVADQIRRGSFTIGLLPNCNGLMGILAGFQRSGLNSEPLRVGLIWLDAHGDINTPETTISGLLAGMPVAIVAGLCLERLRKMCGLDFALPTRNITMVGVRDVDPLEQEILDASEIEYITTEDIQALNPVITHQMERLGKTTDIIYVHVDIDVLDPKEIPGHGLPAEGGPSVSQLGAAFEIMFRFPKVRGLGIAGYPVGRDPDGITLKSVYALIEHAVKRVRARSA